MMKGTGKMAKTEQANSGARQGKRAGSPGRAVVRAKPARSKSGDRGLGLDDLSKLLEHPIIAELISVGAIAAVAAIAQHNVKTRTGEGQKGSKKALKAAGSAAAAAIGKRLMTEFEEIRRASKHRQEEREDA
jgi:hypothetical protein